MLTFTYTIAMRISELPRLKWPSRTKGPRVAPARLPRGSSDTPCRVIAGDNLQALSALFAEMGPVITLAYLDPPFLTGRQHLRVQRGRSKKTGQLTREESPAFDDRFTSLAAYLDVLEPRLRLIHRLLSDHGSMVVHVDPKTSHYVKVLCDEIFGPDCFASEVIWRYRRWPSKTKNFQRVHDVMLRYVKDPKGAPRFNQLYEPLAPSTRATWGDKKQRAVTNDAGRRLRSSRTEDASSGTPLGDVWDISIIAPVARERTGYPTQKPEALLARWIEACTNPGDWILDPYMGSGTSLVAACVRKRRAIGIDESAQAHEVTLRRLEEKNIPFQSQKLSPALARAETHVHSAPVSL